jgi:DNA-binding LytR/AlgR family response regulator
MKTVIIEDEALAADRLEEILKEVNPEIEVLAKIGSIRNAIRWFLENTVDLIFLDIRLSDGLSFSIFEQVAVNTPVIFTTAYDQYAIKAFKLNSIAYLLKPVRKSELMESLQKFQSLKTAYSIDYDRLAAILENRKQSYKKRFLIQIGVRIRRVEAESIAYFFAHDKGVFLKTFENAEYPVEHTLDQLDEQLDPAMFFRINRKYMVNMKAIQQMTAFSRGRIKIDLHPAPAVQDDTIVSIERSKDFKTWMNG